MKILLLGATGTIGTQTIEIIESLKYKLVGISFNNNLVLGEKIINKFNLKYYYDNQHKMKNSCKTVDELIKKTKPDLIVNAVTGFAGLETTLAAINNKVNLALANKESLVVAGKFINDLAAKNKVSIYPIDSEHAALYDIITNTNKIVKSLYITASGGPFYNFTPKQLQKVTYHQAIKHPKWDMGPKISVDSATLVNKYFEAIEAFWYFKTMQIKSLYHPQALVHSVVEFDDNSLFAQMAVADMKLPIQLAISNDKIFKKSTIKAFDFANLNLSFDYIDEKKYPPISWINKTFEKDILALPILINAADEIAFNKFQSGKIKFDEIISTIEWAINNIKLPKIKNISDVYKFDALVRKMMSERK